MFGVMSYDFLRYVVTQRGIEASPKQISAILDLPSPKNSREVQRLTGRIAALNRFISRSTDKCLPFFELLRGNKKFIPPVLSKLEAGDFLPLYLRSHPSPSAEFLSARIEASRNPSITQVKHDKTRNPLPHPRKYGTCSRAFSEKTRPILSDYLQTWVTKLRLRDAPLTNDTLAIRSPTAKGMFDNQGRVSSFVSRD